MTDRAVIAEFYRSAGGATHLHALTVITDFECSDGRIIRTRKIYDVEWSRRCECYLFHHSGNGGGDRVTVSGLYFTSGPVKLRKAKSTWCHRPDPSGSLTRVARKRNRTKLLQLSTPTGLPKHIDLQPGEDLLDWLQNHNVEQDAVWCSECKDWVRGDYLCNHCWWCGKIAWYSTPSDRCGHDPRECEE